MNSRAQPRMKWALVLALVLTIGGGAFVTPVCADGDSNQLVLPRLMATVIALEPHGLATIQTGDGAVRQVVRGGEWQVGDRVTCEQYDGESLATWWTLDCRKAS